RGHRAAPHVSPSNQGRSLPRPYPWFFLRTGGRLRDDRSGRGSACHDRRSHALGTRAIVPHAGVVAPQGTALGVGGQITPKRGRKLAPTLAGRGATSICAVLGAANCNVPGGALAQSRS